MNFENLNIWCWIIPALVGIICGILGYLIGRLTGNTTIDNSEDLTICNDKNAKLEADLKLCNKKSLGLEKDLSLSKEKNIGLEADLAACKLKLTSPPTAPVTEVAAFTTPIIAAIPFDGAAAKLAFGKTVKEDDLKLVEGIGPKIEGMFKENGIKTWKALSDATVAECQAVLDTGGPRYKIHDPASWPMQAKMCYEGKWAELSKWQDEHDHGKL
jgi:predicted flap endonuclease-1-like 5' DNA nuclease